MMSEEEAKTKWCPHARVGSWESFSDGEKTYTANRYADADGTMHRGSTCIASQCMAWKWAKNPKTRRAVYAEAEDVTGARLGGCGMAGRQE